MTNVNGDYTIPFLPPGEYTVKFVLSGFKTETLTTGGPSSQEIFLNARLELAGVRSAVTVVAQNETVSQTSEATTTYSADLLDKLPVSRTILSSVYIAPGVNQNGPNGAVTISGGPVVRQRLHRQRRQHPGQHPRHSDQLSSSRMQSRRLSTMTSGVTAEYGRFTGGVVNAVTKRGGNVFSGSLRDTLANDSKQGPDPDTPTTYIDYVGLGVGSHPRRTDLEGP